MFSLLHYAYYLPNNRATTSWRKLNTNLVYSWAPKPGYRLLLVPVYTASYNELAPDQSQVIINVGANWQCNTTEQSPWRYICGCTEHKYDLETLFLLN